MLFCYKKHGLLSSNFTLSSIHDDFLFVGTSCMDLEDGVMTGQPHGGTAVLWRKSLTAYPVSNVDKNIIGINIRCQNNSKVIINVYLPYNSPSNVEAYLKYLGALQILCEAQQSSIYVLLEILMPIKKVLVDSSSIIFVRNKVISSLTDLFYLLTLLLT